MIQEYIKFKVLRVRKSSHSLPKHGGIIAMFSNRFAKVGMGQTAKGGPDAKNGMRSLPRKNVHNAQDVLSFQ
jgi:hypothetical protein